ncbi:hypothetical protein MPTK1_1g19550 [Marchantia polymorpha subsp. ruderalis]|uniref:Uncharacterized protein n=2 Tax=Marchantia polymorpha TaxID=3197 RepID=A0A176W7A7_MARPO|nr:hypothetical protein AXG93_2490s1430 [Marchantia polymorpha subsp. ruderalis]PTQ50280.1 hypothetical protein MARPO_0001s0294 [Marchantia polymorpha]BBM99200.1 hypothetical protein Mp_1g19550 [Marchantia polymorpha subsp. ruderalis]|eukprot:PTQ50280.1 hypothetical protein MARPO_0001s0294 [Marchantia polymorpha]
MGSDSSSEDEDEEHKARMRSVAIDSSAVINIAAGRGADNSTAKLGSKRKKKPDGEEDFDEDGGLKFAQIRVQDLLHKHLDKSIGASFVDVASEPIAVAGTDENDDFDSEVRLFSRAPLGINLKRPERPKQTSRPKRYDSSDEDETEKVSRLQAAAVDGSFVLTQAEKAVAKARARAIKAVEAAEKAEKEEQERVAKLRKERGEEWLPKIASELRGTKGVVPSSKGQIGRVMDV